MFSQSRNLEIAVIGAGAAGLTAACLLAGKHRVSLFEKNGYFGGHTNTVTIGEGPDAGTPVDTGFIVFNNRNYPTLLKLFAKLGIEGQKSDMSFGFSSPDFNLAYSSYVPDGLFAERRNLFRPSFYRMIADILRFNRRAVRDLDTGTLGGRTLGAYLESGWYGKMFLDAYLIPMGAAIWSTPPGEMFDFPAETFIRFFHHHGLLFLKDRPQWMTVPGGSRCYVEKILKALGEKAFVENAALGVRRGGERVSVRTRKGPEVSFDAVVIAAHADEALKILDDPSAEEKRLLGAWKYTQNRAVLHTDESVMPSNRRAWASWNYTRGSAGRDREGASVTYHMNRLQNLNTRRQYFVTLNPIRPIDPKSIVREIDYTHPCYSFASVRTQPLLPRLNGVSRTFFCGSYFGYGFHEDAVKSALQVTQHFGLSL